MKWVSVDDSFCFCKSFVRSSQRTQKREHFLYSSLYRACHTGPWSDWSSCATILQTILSLGFGWKSKRQPPRGIIQLSLQNFCHFQCLSSNWQDTLIWNLADMFSVTSFCFACFLNDRFWQLSLLSQTLCRTRWCLKEMTTYLDCTSVVGSGHQKCSKP